MKKYYDIEKLAKKLSHKRLREEFIGKESELYKNNYDEFIGLILIFQSSVRYTIFLNLLLK